MAIYSNSIILSNWFDLEQNLESTGVAYLHGFSLQLHALHFRYRKANQIVLHFQELDLSIITTLNQVQNTFMSNILKHNINFLCNHWWNIFSVTRDLATVTSVLSMHIASNIEMRISKISMGKAGEMEVVAWVHGYAPRAGEAETERHLKPSVHPVK